MAGSIQFQPVTTNSGSTPAQRLRRWAGVDPELIPTGHVVVTLRGSHPPPFPFHANCSLGQTCARGTLRYCTPGMDFPLLFSSKWEDMWWSSDYEDDRDGSSVSRPLGNCGPVVAWCRASVCDAGAALKRSQAAFSCEMLIHARDRFRGQITTFTTHLPSFNPFSAGTVFKRQNLTSVDVRFGGLKTVPALKELKNV